ncbi:uncharacterized protein LOC131243470 isoform X2 [Magnolia sinica]|uniref:uncharacterized protein LOC131243470 isoform X2 n=1 Tax=Magnolia sinica TaxID=86752 RepID=UPI0026589CB1|nr:uncharacterized protein LOC131243470 isoform X2 [Magnolia sinica]
MDKARELKRGGSRFSPAKQRRLKASGSLNGCNNLDFSERSKKERVRGLRVSCRASSSNEDSEMGGGGGSEGEEELRLPSTSGDRRFKLNGKAFEDCSTVDPASVPRKLRSAMSKRNRESISPPMPDAKKVHHASNRTEAPLVNGTRRSKHNMQGSLDRPSKQPISITKDEEEVAEALYALAGIFPDSKLATCKVERMTDKEEHSPLPDTAENSLPPSEVSKEESTEVPYAPTATTPTNLSSCQEELPEVTVKAEAVTKPTVPEGPVFAGIQKLDLELNSPAQADLQRNGSLPENEYKEKTNLSGAVNLSIPMQISSESCLGNGLLQTIQPEALPLRKPEENGTLPAVSVAIKQEAPATKESTESSERLTSMEDLRHGMLNGLSNGHRNLTRSSSVQAAAWPDSATGATVPVITGNDVLAVKLPPVTVKKSQSWKRCATHMHISRLICAYQSTEKKSRCALPDNHPKPKEGARSGVIMLKNGLNNILSAGANSLVAERNSSHEARIGIRQDNRFLQDQQSSTSSGVYAQQKQSCDFLSLSAGLESSNNGLESTAQLQVPYLHPLVQHPVMPFSLPHARYSSAYPEQLAAAAAAAAQQVQLQLPQYMGNPFYGPQVGHGGGSVKQQQQQQQQMWVAQMAQYLPPGYPSSLPPKRQNGRHDSPSLVPCTQAAIPPSPSSLELLGATKYSPAPQQPFAFPSSSPSRSKRQPQQHHPSSYDEGGGGGSGSVAGFRSDGLPQHLQLLCNAQHM